VTNVRADERVERQQEEQTAERLGALGDADDGFRLKRMQRPKRRDQQGERTGRGAEPRAQGGQRQRPAHEAHERQRGQGVDRDVERVVAPRVFAAQGVVEREGKVDERPSRRGAAVGRGREHGQRIEAPDGRIVHHGADVVEEKRHAEAIGINEYHRARQAGGKPAA
jgi:hypothetical protein